MSRIDRLLRQYCPNGVVFKQLDEIGNFKRGKLMSKADKGMGEIPIILYGELYTEYGDVITKVVSSSSLELAKKGTPVHSGDILMPITSTTKEAQIGKASMLNVGDTTVYLGGDAIALEHDQCAEYLVQILNSSWFEKYKMRERTGTTVSHLSPTGLKKIRIPLPPIEIQQEIADTLNRFTSLEAGLEAELAARKKQFEYYKDELLSFRDDKSIKWMPLGQVGEFIRGRRFTKDDYVTDGIPVIHYGEIYTRYGTFTDKVMSHVRNELKPRLRFARHGDVVITDVGETVEDVGKAVAWLGNEEVAIHDHCYAFRHTMNPRFVSYYMQTSKFRSDKSKYVARTKVKTLLIKGLSKVCMPVPSLEEQDRIVSILSSFDLLINSTSKGLPAEIGMRHKQYEHYRDKLLVFSELAA